MAELVTGYSGTPHISSDEVGRLLAGTVGSGRYVLETGNQLAATLEDANTLTIATGDALFDGRHVTVSTPETVTIDSGAQGVNRNDIVGIRYLKDAATSVETAELYVYKGTATSGTATDPEYPTTTILDGASEAFMPLYRIQLTGITVATPVKLFDTQESVSAYHNDTGWVDMSSYVQTGFAARPGNRPRARRIGDVVYWLGEVYCTKAQTSNQAQLLSDVPVEFMPIEGSSGGGACYGTWTPYTIWVIRSTRSFRVGQQGNIPVQGEGGGFKLSYFNSCIAQV